MYYEKVIKALEKNKVRYLIAGGMAVNLYGIPRFTKDLDILVDFSKSNLKKLKKVLKYLNFAPKMPVSLDDFLNPENWKKWKKEKGMMALNLYNRKKNYEELDILIHTPLDFSEAVKHQAQFRYGSLKTHVVSLDDLIKMKKKAGRAQDRSDISALKQVKRMRNKK